VIGSVVFLIVGAALGAALRVVALQSETVEATRSAAVHAARHRDVSAAEDVATTWFGGGTVTGSRRGDSIAVVIDVLVEVPHPLGTRWVPLTAGAEMALAPFRSDRG